MFSHRTLTIFILGSQGCLKLTHSFIPDIYESWPQNVWEFTWREPNWSCYISFGDRFRFLLLYQYLQDLVQTAGSTSKLQFLFIKARMIISHLVVLVEITVNVTVYESPSTGPCTVDVSFFLIPHPVSPNPHYNHSHTPKVIHCIVKPKHLWKKHSAMQEWQSNPSACEDFIIISTLVFISESASFF